MSAASSGCNSFAARTARLAISSPASGYVARRTRHPVARRANVVPAGLQLEAQGVVATPGTVTAPDHLTLTNLR